MKRGNRIKLYGERNTGTRYLTRLLAHNLDCQVLRGVVPRWVTWAQALVPGRDSLRDIYFERAFANHLGWKHSQVDIDRLVALDPSIDNLHFVALVKNPYSWLLSLERHPYHRRPDASGDQDSFASLLTSEWPTVGRENGPAAYRDAVDVWNHKVRSYLELASRLPTTLMTYERLVIDPAEAVDEIRQASSNGWRRLAFENLPESTKEKGKDSAFYSDYYGKERWRENLTAEQIQMVNSRLDRELVVELGYSLL